jgi:hypothetical protein
MIIKPAGYVKYSLNTFYLYGFNETGLAKAFAFTLSKDPAILFKFLHYLGIRNKNNESNFREIEIFTERKREAGRTDIEIVLEGYFHVIIEAKVRKNKITDQRTQYLNSFKNQPQKVLCFITQNYDYKKQTADGIAIKNIDWSDIDDLIDEKELLQNSVIRDFQNYLRRGYQLRKQKEILIQDLSDEIEMKKYRKYNVYRRDVIFGSPLYFSPYFTRKSNQPEGEGISYFSKVLGIITCKPEEVEAFKDDLKEFSGNNTKLVTKWINGTKLDKEDSYFTYFFLGDPVRIQKPLLKDGTTNTGRGKNWIAAQIPPNRCVSFEEFVKHM